jgi:ankyrin repeat protein
MTPLTAVASTEIRSLRLLVENGADPDAKDGDGITPHALMIMVVKDNEQREELYETVSKIRWNGNPMKDSV